MVRMSDAAPRSTRVRLTLVAVLATVAVEIALALLLLFAVHRTTIESLIAAGQSLALQVELGIAIGLVLAALQVLLLYALPRWKAFTGEAVGRTTLSVRDIAIISLAVGFAEELLFRAALTPLLGNLWTSLLFAAVHANYAPRRYSRSTWAMGIVALSMVFALSLVLGEVFVRVGLVAAMAAHALYDFVVLMAYRRVFAW